MKLRIRGDSLRLRLTRGEVRALRETGSVRETIHFGASALNYELRSAEVDAPVASFADARILVELPRAQAEAWAPWRSVAARVLWAYYHVEKNREGVR